MGTLYGEILETASLGAEVNFSKAVKRHSKDIKVLLFYKMMIEGTKNYEFSQEDTLGVSDIIISKK